MTFRTIGEASAAVLRNVGSGLKYAPAVQAINELAESEIERQLADAIICSESCNGGLPPLVISPRANLEGDAPLLIAPQRLFGSFRVDFALIATRTGRRVIVECDGWEFHDRTPGQWHYDKMRDRKLLGMGWPTLRFAGIEIKRAIDECIADVAAALYHEEPSVE